MSDCMLRAVRERIAADLWFDREKNMKIEVRNEAGCYSVFVDDIRMVDRESFAIADRVADCLRNSNAYPNSECSEVAESIRKWYDKHVVR